MNKFIIIAIFVFIFSFSSVSEAHPHKNKETEDTQKTELILFERDGCGVCKNEKKFLKSDSIINEKYNVTFLNIGIKENKDKWSKIVDFYDLPKVTPITLIGGDVLVGFSEKTTDKQILNYSKNYKKYGFEYYLKKKNGEVGNKSAATCNVNEASACSINGNSESKSNFNLPFFGEIDVKKTSLFMLSFVLGFIDGFNPCAMWVLLTFLVILSQTGNKKKMIYLAGLFIVAEAVMYFFILNIWYKTWDFISLDNFITPIIGAVAIIGGLYFLYKYHKNKGQLTCDITSLEHQQKTTKKIKDVVSRPITIVTSLVVLGIAFSVNIIEFACSVGIAQSFTKILEINNLSFISQQWYTFIYTFAYMIDDFIIFGLAIFGFQKFHAIGEKYSHLSMLLGGILLILLGILLIFNPEFLMFS